jgi:hypothetical protein
MNSPKIMLRKENITLEETQSGENVKTASKRTVIIWFGGTFLFV